MERNDEPCADLIDLGAASIVTKGPKGEFPDILEGQLVAGLSND